MKKLILLEIPLAVFVAFAMSISTVIANHAVGHVDCGSTITANTTLSSDMSCPATAITIDLDNIVLDCNGHTINYSGTSTGYGVYVRGSDVTIKNCVISQVSGIQRSYAIYLNSSSNSTITDNTLTTRAGWYGYAINLTQSSNNTITRNSATYFGRGSNYIGIPGGSGIVLAEGSNSNDITDNTLAMPPHTGRGTSRTVRGVALSNSSFNNIINNIITSINGNGCNIELSAGSSNNIIKNNYNSIGTGTYGYGWYDSGICLSGNSNSNLLVDNTITTFGYGSFGGWGIILSGSSNNTIKRTVIEMFHLGGGMILHSESNNNQITLNTVTSTKLVYNANAHGIRMLNSTNNNVYHNNFISNVLPHAFVDSSSVNNVFDLNLEGNWWSSHSVTGDPSDGSQPYVFPGGQDNYPYEHQVVVITAEEFAEQQTVDAINIVAPLPPSSVTTSGNQTALGNFLKQVIAALQEGDIGEAQKKLQDAIARTDGCVLRGSPDPPGAGKIKQDYINNCEDQGMIFPLLQDALNALGS